MADAHAMFKAHWKKFYDSNENGTYTDWNMGMVAIYAACIQAEAIANMRDAICQRLDTLEKVIRMELESEPQKTGGKNEN